MIKAVAEEVAKLNPEHKVDLTNPDRTIMLELYRVSFEKFISKMTSSHHRPTSA